MPELARDGLTLYYETHGKGAPVILIAGMASDSQSWQPVIEPLATEFEVIVFDNRTTGRTVPVDAPVSVELMASDAAALLDCLGHERAHVVGHSMGGMIAMYLAAHHPDRVNQLVLAATSPGQNPLRASLVETLVSLREAGVPEDLWYKSFFSWLFAPPFFEDPNVVEAAAAMARDYPYAQSASAMRRQVDSLKGFEPGDMAARIAAPTLGLLGADDLMFPVEASQRGLSTIQDIRFEILPDAGHSVHWDQPAAFAAATKRFLSHGATGG